jgi:hypothetical protein
MVYLIIFIALAAVAGPLLSALPSKRQRQIARWRDVARGAGYQVRCREPSDIPPRLQRITDSALVCYAARRHRDQAKSLQQGLVTPQNSSLWVRTVVGWQSREDDPLPDWLESISTAVEVVALSPQEALVYWTERGNEEDLEQVLRVLDRLRS